MSSVDQAQQSPQWTEEQALAIERRTGNLLLDAGAGSGKTSVLVERFVRAVLEDGVDVRAVLAITFTDKAAAELRERIRERLRALGADEQAGATEAAFISTIHGFCARLLRTHALLAGLDPRFVVLDQPEAERLAGAAFDEALEELAREGGAALDLIASYTPASLRSGILGIYDELRARGQSEPSLPPLEPAPDLAPARRALAQAADEVRRELGAVVEPSARVVQALERLGGCEGVLGTFEPSLEELERLKLPGGNGAALSTPACQAYTDALARFRGACEHRRAGAARDLLDRLLRGYGALYARRKREASALDFEDLELMTRDLLARDGQLRDLYRRRFAHVMVDELQDVNKVQLELIGHLAAGNLFTVGDAQQSIYGFRHADVELFEALGAQRERLGERATLHTNFRSRPEILEVINDAFEPIFDARFTALRAGREDAPDGEPLVELIVVDKGGDWASEGLASPWRIAEAEQLAGRLEELIAHGTRAAEVVVLTRATTDLRVYERALEERGIATYVIGGRGYWGHPQVVDLVAYLRILANPRDGEQLYTVLASPLVGVSADALVVLGAAARARDSDPWAVLREREHDLDELGADDLARLDGFAAWFGGERAAANRLAVEELIERALVITGYDLAMLAMPGGQRRLANVRKLMRLGREFETAAGPGLRPFLDFVRGRTQGWAGFGDARESEAPVEGEGLDAVRLMTIHRAKGLQFNTVCVADLGRAPRWAAELIRVGRDGRFGLRLSEPGTGKPTAALAYEELGEQQRAAQEREERRLFYVAMTRAQERLIVSGAAKLDAWEKERAPMGWVGPALIEAGVQPRCVEAEPRRIAAAWSAGRQAVPVLAVAEGEDAAIAGAQALSAGVSAGPSQLSYSSLESYLRCGYRFYVERVLGMPAMQETQPAAGSRAGSLSGAERGVLVHAMLERLDFRRPQAPTAATVSALAERPLARAEAEQIAALLRLFIDSEMRARLASADNVRREQRFAFPLLDGLLVNGAIDVLAREPDGRMLVLDYKSDRLEGADPSSVVEDHYATQRLIYALAVLRAGASEVEVAHVFLEAPRSPVRATFTAGQREALERRLSGLARGVLERHFVVAEEPRRAICSGCPAEGGLCSWPLGMTRRERPDQLF